MKKFMIYVLTAVLTALGTVCALNATSAKAMEPITGMAAVVAKAKAIQEGIWDASLGPYKEPDGSLNYRYRLMRDGDGVTFELLAIDGGIQSLASDLAKALG